MAAAHPDERRRIIVWRALRGELLLRRAQQLGRKRRTDDAETDAVQEIAARNRLMHPEAPIGGIHEGILSMIARYTPTRTRGNAKEISVAGRVGRMEREGF
jgi:hypothetical protein